MARLSPCICTIHYLRKFSSHHNRTKQALSSLDITCSVLDSYMDHSIISHRRRTKMLCCKDAFKNTCSRYCSHEQQLFPGIKKVEVMFSYISKPPRFQKCCYHQHGPQRLTFGGRVSFSFLRTNLPSRSSLFQFNCTTRGFSSTSNLLSSSKK